MRGVSPAGSVILVVLLLGCNPRDEAKPKVPPGDPSPAVAPKQERPAAYAGPIPTAGGAYFVVHGLC